MNDGFSHSRLVRFDDRESWLVNRFGSIGSSDAAVILGYGYAGSSRYSLWAEKCHGITTELKEATLKMFAKGHAAEPYLAELCRIEKGWDVQFDPENSFRRSLSIDYLTASLDGWMIEDGEHVVLEFKNVSDWASRDWDVRSGKAPLKYSIQVQHQLAVTGWNRGYLVALVGSDMFPVEVKRHDDLIGAMLEEYAIFWDCVKNEKEPEIDESEATYRAVSRVHIPEPMEVQHLDAEGTAMVDRFIELEKSIAAETRECDLLRNRMVSVSGKSEYVVTADGRWFSFKAVRGGKRKLKPCRGRVRA